MSHIEKLKKLLAKNQTIIAPGMYDGLTGLLVEQAGFDCAYVGGASISYSQLGRSDIGLTTCSEVAETISKIRERIEIPFIVDGDTGGQIDHLDMKIKSMERLGISAVIYEDKKGLKQNSLFHSIGWRNQELTKKI